MLLEQMQLVANVVFFMFSDGKHFIDFSAKNYRKLLKLSENFEGIQFFQRKKLLLGTTKMFIRTKLLFIIIIY